MRTVKKYVIMSMLLIIYIVAVTILLRSYYVYQDAYHELSRLVSHPSVELRYDKEE